MRELNTEFGKLYIEELSNLEEADIIKIYDSDKKYLDYWEFDILEELATDRQIKIEEVFEDWCNDVCNCEFLDDLLTMELCIRFKSIQVGVDFLKLYLGWSDAKDGEFDIRQQDYVNRIGDYYIVTK